MAFLGSSYTMFFGLLFLVSAVFALYDATWTTSPNMEDGFFSANLAPQPGYMCEHGSLCTQALELLVEIFPGAVRMRIGKLGLPDQPNVDSLLDLTALGKDKRVPMSESQFDIQYTESPFGMRVVRRSDGTVLYNSVLYPGFDFVDGAEYAEVSEHFDAQEQYVHYETAGPSPSCAAFGLGHRTLTSGGHFIWPGAATDVSLPVLFFVNTARQLQNVSVDPSSQAYAYYFATQRPLRVTLSEENFISMEQTGGQIDMLIVTANIPTTSDELHTIAGVAKTLNSYLPPRVSSIGSSLLELQAVLSANTVEDFVKQVNSYENMSVSGYFLNTFGMALTNEAGEFSSEEFKNKLAEVRKKAAVYLPAYPFIEMYRDADDDNHRTWEAAVQANALIKSHDHQARTDGLGHGVYATKLQDSLGDTSQHRVGLLDFTYNQAIEFYHSFINSRFQCQIDGLFSRFASPRLECNGLVCTGDDTEAQKYNFKPTFDPSSNGVCYRSLPFDQKLSTGNQSDSRLTYAAGHIESLRKLMRDSDSNGVLMTDVLSIPTTRNAEYISIRVHTQPDKIADLAPHLSLLGVQGAVMPKSALTADVASLSLRAQALQIFAFFHHDDSVAIKDTINAVGSLRQAFQVELKAAIEGAKVGELTVTRPEYLWPDRNVILFGDFSEAESAQGIYVLNRHVLVVPPLSLGTTVKDPGSRLAYFPSHEHGKYWCLNAGTECYEGGASYTVENTASAAFATASGTGLYLNSVPGTATVEASTRSTAIFYLDSVDSTSTLKVGQATVVASIKQQNNAKAEISFAVTGLEKSRLSTLLIVVGDRPFKLFDKVSISGTKLEKATISQKIGALFTNVKVDLIDDIRIDDLSSVVITLMQKGKPGPGPGPKPTPKHMPLWAVALISFGSVLICGAAILLIVFWKLGKLSRVFHRRTRGEHYSLINDDASDADDSDRADV